LDAEIHELALPLFVTRILADHSKHAAPFDDFAFIANFLN